MSPRRRHGLAALLAEASLADRDIERERLRAQRDSQNFSHVTSALRSLVPAATDLAGKYGERVSEDAALEGQALLGENLTATGDESETPEEMASRLTSGRAALAEPENDGKPRSVLRAFVDDPLGFKAHARKSAAVGTQGALAKQIRDNRDAAEKKTIATEDRARKIANEDAANAPRFDDVERDRVMGNAFARVQNDVDADEASRDVDDGARALRMQGALDGVRASVDADSFVSKPAIAQDKAETKQSDADLRQLAAFARNPKTQGLIGPEGWAQLERIGVQRPKAAPASTSSSTEPKALTDKERAAKAKADIAEAKATKVKREASEALSLDAIPAGFRIDDTTKRQLQKARNDVIATQAASNQIRTLIKKYPQLESYVGPLDGPAGFIANKLGVSSTQGAEIASTLDRSFTAFKVAATGASAGIKEMADLENQVPNRSDSLAQILGKLEAGDAIVAQGLAQIDGVLSTGDVRNASGATTSTPRPSTNAAPSDAERSAAVLYRRVLNDAQRARANELIAQGIDRVRAVNMALGGE